MQVLLYCDKESQEVIVTSLAATTDGQTRGKMVLKIRPGQDFYGHTYEALMRLGHGPHEIQPVAKQPTPR